MYTKTSSQAQFQKIFVIFHNCYVFPLTKIVWQEQLVPALGSYQIYGTFGFLQMTWPEQYHQKCKISTKLVRWWILSFLATFKLAHTQSSTVSTLLQSSCGFTRLALQELYQKSFVIIVNFLLLYYKQIAILSWTHPFSVSVALIVVIETLESASPRRSAERIHF